MIVVAKQGQRITEEDVDLAVGGWNRDGLGLAWWEGDQVRWLKGLDEARTLRALAGLEARAVIGPIVLHARLATSGGTSRALCHPFPIEEGAPTRLVGEAQRVMLHNGIWSGWEGVARLVGVTPDKGWSDTRLMAHLAALFGEERAAGLFDDSGRVVTLDARGTLRFYGSGWVDARGLTWSSSPTASVAQERAWWREYGKTWGGAAAKSKDYDAWGWRGASSTSGTSGKNNLSGFRAGGGRGADSDDSDAANVPQRWQEPTAASAPARTDGPDCKCETCAGLARWREREAARERAAAEERYAWLRTAGVVGSA